MKCLFFFFYLLIFVLFSQNAFALNASVDIYRFDSKSGQYVDVYLRILANTISYRANDKGSYNGSIDVLMMIKKEEEIVGIEKYRLNTQGIEETKDMLDRKRFGLDPALYTLEVILTDVQDTFNRFHVAKIFSVNAKNSEPHFSDVQLLTDVKACSDNDFCKNGLYLETSPYNLVTESRTNLSFYTEFFNLNADSLQEYIFGYAIYPYTDTLTKETAFLYRYKKVKQQPISAFVYTMDVGKLISGDYILKVMILDKDKKEIYSKSQAFISDNIPADLAYARNYNHDVDNSFVATLDSARVDYILKAMNPIMFSNLFSTYEEVRKGDNLKAKKYLILKFWNNKYPSAPEKSFLQYMHVAELIDREYNSNFGKGFQTDRGHTFLKYGKPSKVVAVDDEPNTPPYEIWYYDYMEATKQNDVRFIFFNPSLAPNDFQLLHSTCYGSRNNPAWEVQLYRNSPEEIDGPNTIEATRMKDNWQRRARRLFEDI